jgi:Peptidase_C39 like family
MIGTGIAFAARTIGHAGLAAATALALAAGTAHAAPGAPDPPSGTGTLYGDPAAAAPFWRYQEYDDDCVEMAVADVVGELTGHQPSEEAIVKVAQSTHSTVHGGPIYTKPGKRRAGSGTSFDDEPALLAHYGIHGTSRDGGSIKGLEQDLAKGRKVIVGVNAEVLWREPVEDKDSDGEPEANHAVVVTGIDTGAAMVHLNDSGSETGRDEQVPMDIFMRSWHSSDEQLTVTG